MKTPREKYNNDPEYRQLVDMLEHFIHIAQYTPSEIREAAIFACIHYEMNMLRPIRIEIPLEVAKSVGIIENFINEKWK